MPGMHTQGGGEGRVGGGGGDKGGKTFTYQGPEYEYSSTAI